MRKKFLFFLLPAGFVLTTGIISFTSAVRLVGEYFPGFLLYPNKFVSISLRQNWHASSRGITPLLRVVEINGDGNFSFSSFIGKKDPLNVKILKKGKEEVLSLQPVKFTYSDFIILFLIPFIAGLVFLFTGISILFIKPDYRPAIIFFFLSMLISSFYFYFIDANFFGHFFRLWLLFPFFAVFSYYLFMHFPEMNVPLFFRISFYPIAGAAFILSLLGEFFMNSNIFPSIFKTYPLYMAIVFIADIGILGIKWKKSSDSLTRKKARVMLFTVLLASSVPAIWGLTYPFGAEIVNTDRAMLLTLFFPALTVYAILKVNVFEIDRVFQKALGYLFLSTFVVGIYLLIVLLVSLFFQVIFGMRLTPLEMITGTLLVALLFHPMRVKVQEILKKTIYREDFLRERQSEDFIKSLSKTMDPEALGRLVEESFKKIFSFERVEIFGLWGKEVLKGEHRDEMLKINPEEMKSFWKSLKEEDIFVRKIHLKKGIHPPSSIPSWVEVIMFLYTFDELRGFVFLGEPRHRGAIGGDELEIMKKIIPPLSLAMENAFLHRESVMRERLATIGNVASIVIHEIKNPLGVIKISANALKRKFLSEDSGYRLAHFIEQEVDRIDRISRQILNYARFGEPVYSHVNLRELIEMCIRSVFENHFEVKVKFNAKEDIFIPCDKTQMEQAIINLLSNAKDAVEGDESRVSVSVEVEGEEVGISVIDEGTGIDEAVRKNLFTPFITTKKNGTGLGLCIVKNVVDAHSGRIEVRNNNPRGTIFTIYLPLSLK